MNEQTQIDPAWLPFLPTDSKNRPSRPQDMAENELALWKEATGEKRTIQTIVDKALGDGYRIDEFSDRVTITGGETGVLYGTYAYMMNTYTGLKLPSGPQQPAYALRMIDCWDNMTGSIERSYAGKSLFFRDGDIVYDERRIHQLARMLASIGINVICLNNVNVNPPAEELLTKRFLPKVKALADILSAYGIRVMLSIDYAMPTYEGLHTADPLDEQVQAFWIQQVDQVYQAVPSLAGFLVKADSEYRPGPFTYGRDHAQGANLIARALKPHGGVLVWRCFVYNCRQDWRDQKTDRPKAAYESYAYLDGQFDENVILQIKNGPYDFQVREPLSPLLLCMPKTAKALEVQLAQEYTGHQIDLYAMTEVWEEIWEQLPKQNITAIAAVSNLGDDPCWTGHPFAQFNLFAYGRMAWQPMLSARDEMALWIKLSYALQGEALDTLIDLLSQSRAAYQKYTSPLGLGWMVNPNNHYGPNPEGYEYALWGTYHRANRDAVGIDRTKAGTDYISQYPEEFAKQYATPERCPDELKLFFHRLRYDYRMADGRTMIQRIYDDHFEGAQMAEDMLMKLETLKDALPSEVYGIAHERMILQVSNAKEWRDIINNYFFRLSGVADEKGRKIYA